MALAGDWLRDPGAGLLVWPRGGGPGGTGRRGGGGAATAYGERRPAGTCPGGCICGGCGGECTREPPCAPIPGSTGTSAPCCGDRVGERVSETPEGHKEAKVPGDVYPGLVPADGDIAEDPPRDATENWCADSAASSSEPEEGDRPGELDSDSDSEELDSIASLVAHVSRPCEWPSSLVFPVPRLSAELRTSRARRALIRRCRGGVGFTRGAEGYGGLRVPRGGEPTSSANSS